VAILESMSAHADSTEILRWLGGFKRAPRDTFIVHGELSAMETLAGTISAKLGWKCRMPEWKETANLEPGVRI
jgi:metallo-beta-lactamase family protein